MVLVTYVFWCLFSLAFATLVLPYPYQEHNRSYPQLMQPTLYVGGNGPGNYSHIQDAIDNATDGTLIFVYKDGSPYYENILVHTSVDIVGENKDTTIIDGVSRYNVLSIVADAVTITGFTIQYGGSSWSNVGVYISATDVVIVDNIIQYNANGVFIEGASYNQVLNNTINNNIYHSIRLEYTAYNHILDNQIINNDNGIYLWESAHNLILRNNLRDNNWEGLIIGEFCDDNLIYHNNFIDTAIEHAYDLSHNSWDGGYPTGGNYWDDYQGEDLDNDGIGDTPYVIRGPYGIDHYPLMNPYGYEIPEVTISITGGLGVTIRIEDQRNESSMPLPIDTWLMFSYPFRERFIPGIDPLLSIHLMANISNNQQVTLKSLPPFLLGVGRVNITVQINTYIVSESKQVVSWLVFPR